MIQDLFPRELEDVLLKRALLVTKGVAKSTKTEIFTIEQLNSKVLSESLVNYLLVLLYAVSLLIG